MLKPALLAFVVQRGSFLWIATGFRATLPLPMATNENPFRFVCFAKAYAEQTNTELESNRVLAQAITLFVSSRYRRVLCSNVHRSLKLTTFTVIPFIVRYGKLQNSVQS